MKNVLVLGLLLALSTLACKKDDDGIPEKTFNLNDTVTIAMNQTAVLIPDDMSIKLLEIKEDSRCPEGAVCVWEGRAVARLRFAKGDAIATRELATISSASNPADTLSVFGRKVKLLDVLPYPVVDEEIPQKDYKVKIVVN